MLASAIRYISALAKGLDFRKDLLSGIIILLSGILSEYQGMSIANCPLMIAVSLLW